MAITKDSVNNIQVDNSAMNPSVGNGNTRGTVSSILQSREQTNQSINNYKNSLLSSSRDIDDLLNKFKKLEESVNKITNADASKLVNSFKEIKNIDQIMSNLKDSQKKMLNLVEAGNTDTKELRDLYYDIQQQIIDGNQAFLDGMYIRKEASSLGDKQKKTEKDITKELREQSRTRRLSADQQKKALKEQKQQEIKYEKEAAKSASKALMDSMRTALSTIKDNLLTNQLLDIQNSTQRSAAAQIELDYMKSYNLTKKEFDTMKHAIYDQVDTSIFTTKEIQGSMQTLLDANITSTNEIIKYTGMVTRSTKLLGLSSEEQSQMLKLNNKLGYNFYEFSTNRLATYMTKSMGISQKQLAEIQALNTNIVSSMSDFDVNSEAFGAANSAEIAGMTAGGIDMNKYGGSMSSALSNIVGAGSEAVTGMGADAIRSRLNNGAYLSDILKNNTGLAGTFWNEYVQGGYKANPYLEEQFASSGLSSDTQALIKQYANLERTQGDLHSYFDTFNTTNNKALDELNGKEKEDTSLLRQLTNSAEAWLSDKVDWIDLSDFETSMTAIIKLLGIIAAADTFNAIKDLGSSIKGLFKGLGTKLGENKLVKGLAGSKAMSWMGTGGLRHGLTKAGAVAGGASIAGGVIWGGIDAYSNVRQSDELYGKGHKVGAGVSGFFGGAGVKKDAKGKVSTGKTVGSSALSGAGKGALIGAGIGTFIGGPAGTLVGGAIGAGVGAIGGALSGWWKSKKVKEQEQLKALEDIKQNTAATAKNTANGLDLEATRFASSDRTSFVPRGGAIGGGGSPISPQSTAARAIGGDFKGKNGEYFGPWLVTSYFNERRTYKNTRGQWVSDVHKGIDLAKEGTNKIYAAAGGLVNYSYSAGAGNHVTVTDDKGHVYHYMHLRSTGLKTGDKIKKGDGIGIMGSTGNVTGQHLHFQVNSGANPINPVPYMNTSIYSGDTSGSKVAFSSSGSTSSASQQSDALSKAFQETKSTIKFNSANQSGLGFGGDGAIVHGLTDIKQTLIDLANRQTQDERIMNMLTGREKVLPRIN